MNEDPSKYQQVIEADDDLANVSDDQLVADTSGADDTEDGQIVMGVSDLLDPYQKIKLNANLCMRNLFKNNSKVLFNYWFIMFP